jgi:carbon monoxide dehydrogenase subunit G
MELEHDFTVPVPVDQAWGVLLDVERIAPCMPGATLDSIDGDEFTGRLKVRLGAMTITYRGAARITARDEKTHTVTIEGSGKEARGSGTANATVRATLHDEDGQTRVTVHTTLNVTGRPAQFGRNILSEVGGRLIGRFAGNLADEITREEAPAQPEPTSAESDTTPATDTAAATGDGTPQTPAPRAEPAEAEAAPAASAESATDTAAATGDGAPQAPAPEAAPTEPAPAPEGKAAARPSAEAIDLLEVAGPSIAKRAAPLFAALAAVWALRRLIRRRGRR